MRRWYVLACLAGSCVTSPPPPPYYGPTPPPPTSDAYAQLAASPADITQTGHLDDRMVDFRYDGGQLEFDMYRLGHRVVLAARNRYAVPIMVSWSVGTLENLRPVGDTSGVLLVPPRAALARQWPARDPHRARAARYDASATAGRSRSRRGSAIRTRLPIRYEYGLPFPRGKTFAVLQGFHGAFSHRGSNEFAVDFDCPVATPVLATRPGIVVAANATAQGSGTTPDYLEYKRTNFVLVIHDDGTLGEYMHLAPATVEVKPGQRVERGRGARALRQHRLLVDAAPPLPGDDRRQPDGVVRAVVPVRAGGRAGQGRGAHAVQRRYTGWETRAVDAPMP